MKKICIILGCLILPFLVSCQREYVQPDALYSLEFDLRPGDWTAMGDCFQVDLDVKEITRKVCQTGSVQCFLVYEDGTQASLPMQRFLSAEVENPETGEKSVVYYQKQIEFEYAVGVVSLFYTFSDFYYEGYPERMTVRVAIHY